MMKCGKGISCCFVSTLIVVVALGTFVLFGYFSQKNAILLVDEKTENSPLLQKAFISLSELKSERIGPRVCVKGDGTNVSESTLGYVKVFVVLFSKNGEVFDFASGDIQSTRIMRSGDTFSFSRCVEDEKWEIDEKKYEIYFERKIGSDYKNTEIPYVMK